MIDYKKISLSNQVFEKLEESVLHGVYPQGSTITAEKAASDLQVNIAPVREAFVRLEDERLIAEAASGFTVLGITAGDIEDMFNVKRRIEADAAGFAAERMTDDELAELRAVLEEQEKAVSAGDAEKVRNLDTRFHDIIYAGSGSNTYDLILSPMHHRLSKYRKASLEKSDRIMTSVSEHRKIYEAMAGRDRSETEKLMLIHIENAYKSITAIEKERQK